MPSHGSNASMCDGISQVVRNWVKSHSTTTRSIYICHGFSLDTPGWTSAITVPAGSFPTLMDSPSVSQAMASRFGWFQDREIRLCEICGGNLWEICGTYVRKSMENMWEIDGKSAGNMWEVYGKCMGLMVCGPLAI